MKTTTALGLVTVLMLIASAAQADKSHSARAGYSRQWAFKKNVLTKHLPAIDLPRSVLVRQAGLGLKWSATNELRDARASAGKLLERTGGLIYGKDGTRSTVLDVAQSALGIVGHGLSAAIIAAPLPFLKGLSDRRLSHLIDGSGLGIMLGNTVLTAGTELLPRKSVLSHYYGSEHYSGAAH